MTVEELLEDIDPYELPTEERESLWDIKKKFSKSRVDPMGKMSTINVPFGESKYYFEFSKKQEPSKAREEDEDDEEKEKPKNRFALVQSTSPYQFLGYECLDTGKGDE